MCFDSYFSKNLTNEKKKCNDMLFLNQLTHVIKAEISFQINSIESSKLA